MLSWAFSESGLFLQGVLSHKESSKYLMGGWWAKLPLNWSQLLEGSGF